MSKLPSSRLDSQYGLGVGNKNIFGEGANISRGFVLRLENYRYLNTN
jgi:hypothetical protein